MTDKVTYRLVEKIYNESKTKVIKYKLQNMDYGQFICATSSEIKQHIQNGGQVFGLKLDAAGRLVNGTDKKAEEAHRYKNMITSCEWTGENLGYLINEKYDPNFRSSVISVLNQSLSKDKNVIDLQGNITDNNTVDKIIMSFLYSIINKTLAPYNICYMEIYKPITYYNTNRIIKLMNEYTDYKLVIVYNKSHDTSALDIRRIQSACRDSKCHTIIF